MRRIVSSTLLTLLTFAALGPPIGAITIMLEIVLIPDHGLPTVGSRSILDLFGSYLFMTMVAMLFSYKYVKTALVCGLVASVVRLVVRRSDVQIGLTTLAGVAIGVYLTLVGTAGIPPAHRASEYFQTIALCAVPAFACACISRPRPLAVLPVAAPTAVASPINPDTRLPL